MYYMIFVNKTTNVTFLLLTPVSLIFDHDFFTKGIYKLNIIGYL